MKGANPDVRRVTRAVKRTDDGRNPGKGLAEKHATRAEQPVWKCARGSCGRRQAC